MPCEVVASILPRRPADAQRLARTAAMQGADWVELRLDRWPPDAPLEPTLHAISLPVLATCRLPCDGGHFAGSAAERRSVLERALRAGARGVDLEHWEEWQPQPRPRLLVRSLHALEGVPEDLPKVRDRLLARGANLAKIVVTATDLADVAPVTDLLAATDQAREPTVAFAMGEAVWPSRLLAVLLGAPVIYGSADPRAATAPGQVPVDLLLGLYRVRQLGAATAVLGVVGDPVLHSAGPWLHNRAFHRLRFDGVYLPLQTARPLDVITMLPPRRRRGLSVTAPHKEAAQEWCHRLDDLAQAAQAVNTVVFQAGGQVVGHNTDVPGVSAALWRTGLRRGDGAPAAVLGGGGAGRAAAVALAAMGFAVTVLVRDPDRLQSFCAARGFRVAPLQTDVLEELGPRAVVHATPVGSLAADPDARLLPDWRPTPGQVVMDAVYRPKVTRLLREARADGATVVGGEDWFVAQAAAQLTLFTGEGLPPDDLREFLAGS